MSYKDKFRKKMDDRTYEERLMKNYKKRREKSEERTNAYSYFLAVVCVAIAVMFFVYGSLLLGFVFLGLGGFLVLLVYLTKRADKKEKNKKDKDKEE